MIKYGIMHKTSMKPLKIEETTNKLSTEGNGKVYLFDSYDEGFRVIEDPTRHDYKQSELMIIAVDA